MTTGNSHPQVDIRELRRFRDDRVDHPRSPRGSVGQRRLVCGSGRRVRVAPLLANAALRIAAASAKVFSAGLRPT